MAFQHPPRKSHRRRISALRLSSDTTNSLPEYIPSPGWHHQPAFNSSFVPSDNPPDYPDSAGEDADEDTDTDAHVVHLPPSSSATNSPRLNPASPRRGKRFLPTHKRKQSSQLLFQQEESTDPFLDSLLERSVHALEMSNTLLQSSISTQSSLSAILAHDSPADNTLEASAMSLSTRIRDDWSNDLDKLTQDVETLFVSPDASRSRRYPFRSENSTEGSMSCSLPSSTSPMLRKSTRRPSLDLRQASSEEVTPRLNLSSHPRKSLISPPPRALTQYVASTQDAESILLPPTLGVRSPPSVHRGSEWKPLTEIASSSVANSSTNSLPPKLTDKPLEPSTPAYNMLSSFVYRGSSSGSATPSTSFTSSFMKRRSSSASTSTERPSTRRRTSTSPASYQHHSDRTPSRTRTQTPNRSGSPTSVMHRPMTPPVEESSSSSSDGVVAKQTVKSLRKILDEQPSNPDQGASRIGARISRSPSIKRMRAPAFMPRTAAPLAEAGTSTATASVSRLFTKGAHTLSTRPPSPPRSAMKRSAGGTPSGSSSATHSKNNSLSGTRPSSPSILHIPGFVVKALSSGSNSGASTPNKRISFAELPESYASTKPGGAAASAMFKEKQEQSRRKRAQRKKGIGGSGGSGDRSSGNESWWNGWLTGGPNPHGLSMSLARQHERMEDRATRNWGGRMGAGLSGGMDEWAI